jgi:hypothetical protein
MSTESVRWFRSEFYTWLICCIGRCWSVASRQVSCSIYLFIYLALPTRAGSPQQHMPITVGPFCLTHPVNFPCGRKPEYPEETHDFRQSVDFLLFSHEDWVRVALRKFSLRLEPAASEVKGKCANHLATEAPKISSIMNITKSATRTWRKTAAIITVSLHG